MKTFTVGVALQTCNLTAMRSPVLALRRQMLPPSIQFQIESLVRSRFLPSWKTWIELSKLLADGPTFNTYALFLLLIPV